MRRLCSVLCEEDVVLESKCRLSRVEPLRTECILWGSLPAGCAPLLRCYRQISPTRAKPAPKYQSSAVLFFPTSQSRTKELYLELCPCLLPQTKQADSPEIEHRSSNDTPLTFTDISRPTFGTRRLLGPYGRERCTMPKVKSYSAPWLSNYGPGHRLFEQSADALRAKALSPAASSKRETAPGPRRTIASRGTQVFVAAGKEVRWGDLAYIKDQWSEGQARGRNGSYGGPRIKREDSTLSIEETVEQGNAPGMRVGSTAPSPLLETISNLPVARRLSRHDALKTSASSSSRPTLTCSPFSPPTPFTSASSLTRPT